ncbi:hypothetical protein Trydic_g7249 [Trypoxylus dichotomus]
MDPKLASWRVEVKSSTYSRASFPKRHLVRFRLAHKTAVKVSLATAEPSLRGGERHVDQITCPGGVGTAGRRLAACTKRLEEGVAEAEHHSLQKAVTWLSSSQKKCLIQADSAVRRTLSSSRARSVFKAPAAPFWAETELSVQREIHERNGEMMRNGRSIRIINRFSSLYV